MSRWLAALVVAVVAITAGAMAQEEAEGPALPPQITDPAIETPELALRLIPLTVDELAAAAEEWLAIVKAKTQELVDAQIAAADGDDAARERAADLADERAKLFDDYATVIDAWEKKGGDDAAIARYRAYRNAILVEQTRTADAQTLLTQAAEWATARDGGVQLLIDAAVIVASFLGLVIVARLVRRVVRRWFGRVPNLSKLLQGFLSMAVYWVVLSVGILIVLSAVGVDISPVFALFGGAAFIFAFALQDTLGNLAAGVMIMLNRPFDEGDYVDIAGTAGTVQSVNVSSTTVATPDNQMIVIPNSKVWGNVITNVTTSPTRRVDLMFGIGYDDSIEQAQAVLERLVAAHPLTLDDPAPVIRVHALGESSVDFIVRPWVKGADYWTVYWDLTRQVKEAFDAEGISIPFPQRDIHLKGGDGGGAAEAVSSPSETVSRGAGATPAHES